MKYIQIRQVSGWTTGYIHDKGSAWRPSYLQSRRHCGGDVATKVEEGNECVLSYYSEPDMLRYLSACCVLDIIRHFQMLYIIAYQLKCDIMGIAQDLLCEVLDSDSTLSLV